MLLIIPFKAFAIVFLADFLTGFVHWLEDAYGREDFPVTGRLITQPNIRHHREPRYFVHHSWLHSSWDLLLLHSAVVIGAVLMHRLNWQIVLFALVGTNANQIHKWAHRTPRENGRLITWLQKHKVIQGTRHHARHHTDPKKQPLLHDYGYRQSDFGHVQILEELRVVDLAGDGHQTTS